MSAVPLESPVLPTPARSRAAFRYLRWSLTRNTLRSVFAASRLRTSMVLFCSAVFWAGLFGLFFGGFEFINNYGALSGDFVEYIFSLFFLSLLIMLFFSTGIIVYTAMFQSKESAFLLATPAPPDRIFAYKFLEAIGFSSWAFVLLGSPMLVAYGIIAGVPASYYVMILLYLVAFVLIPGSLGSIAAILTATYFPRRQKTVLASLGIGVMLLGAFLLWRVWRTPGDALTAEWLDGLLGRLSFCQNPLLPSRWMSKGLIEASKGNTSSGAFYLFVIGSNAGLAYIVAAVAARDLYRKAYSRVQGGKSSRRMVGWYALDELFHKVFFFIARPIRLLILKDLRTFRRDPAQWSQFLIFFGLLALYFINIRRLSYDLQKPYWRNLVSFLNLGVTALILSTFTSRFIFPLLSLEGRNFWVLGLLPLKRASILWGKFAFSAGISLVSTEVLIVISDTMLRMGPMMTVLHMGMIAILCLGLSGISVGLGARLPNFKEDDPSKIAAGFGGTFNLLVSLVFIGTVVTSLAIPSHLYFMGQDEIGLGSGMIDEGQFYFWLAVATLSSLALGIVAVVVPLRIGIKAFQRMEF